MTRGCDGTFPRYGRFGRIAHLSMETGMPETAPPNQAQNPAPQNTAPKALTPADQHEKAARCHEMAAALHHEAARFHADGDEENARECAKQAVTHANRANELAAQLAGQSPAVTTH